MTDGFNTALNSLPARVVRVEVVSRSSSTALHACHDSTITCLLWSGDLQGTGEQRVEPDIDSRRLFHNLVIIFGALLVIVFYEAVKVGLLPPWKLVVAIIVTSIIGGYLTG